MLVIGVRSSWLTVATKSALTCSSSRSRSTAERSWSRAVTSDWLRASRSVTSSAMQRWPVELADLVLHAR